MGRWIPGLFRGLFGGYFIGVCILLLTELSIGRFRLVYREQFTPDDTQYLSLLLSDRHEEAGSQTVGTWQKQYRKLETRHEDVKQKLKAEQTKVKRSRTRMKRKYKIKASNVECESEAKSTLLGNVKTRVASLTLEIDSLINRIQEKRLVLDKQRSDNKMVLMRYEQIYQEFAQKYDS